MRVSGWNSIQLLWSREQWKIVSIFWEATGLAERLRRPR
jgi:hypothetical protein